MPKFFPKNNHPIFFFRKKFSASKNQKLRIVRNACCRSFAPIRAMFAGLLAASAGFTKRKQCSRSFSRSFSMFSSLLGPVSMRSDTFRCIWMCSGAFRPFQIISVISLEILVFRYFGEVFEELRKNGNHRRVLPHFLLRMHLFGSQYDPWSSSWERVPSRDDLRECS